MGVGQVAPKGIIIRSFNYDEQSVCSKILSEFGIIRVGVGGQAALQSMVT